MDDRPGRSVSISGKAMKNKAKPFKVMVTRGPSASKQESLSLKDYIIDETYGYRAMVTARMLERSLSLRFKKYNVLFGEWPILLFLWAEEKASQRDLSRLIYIHEGAIARTTERMIKKGLVRRKKSKNDGRRYIVEPTERGWALRDRLLAEVEAIGNLIARDVSASDMKVAMRVHLTVTRALRDALPDANL